MAVMPEPGILLIKQFEGCHLEAYPDPLSGAEPYTIGWGSTRRQDGTPFYLGERITQAEADDLLLWQIDRDFLPAIATIPNWHGFTDGQAGAMLSFAYNLGAGFYGASGFQTITRVLQNADWINLEYALTRYRNPGSNVEEGLLRRRLSEARVFLDDTPGYRLTSAGETYFAEASRTYYQSSQLSDQAFRYLRAIAGRPTHLAQSPPPASPSQPETAQRTLALTEPPITGGDVRLVQEALVEAGAPLDVDSIFGPSTEQAVQWFQRLNGLPVDGVVAAATRSQLLQRSLYLTEPYLFGEDVKTLQSALNRQGFDLTADGVFGLETRDAIEAFQRRTGLLVDGVVGNHSRRILNARMLYLKLPYLQGDDVEWLQKTLTRFGLSTSIDGVFGPGTEWTVKQFQARNHLNADGVVGAQTWVKLGL